MGDNAQDQRVLNTKNQESHIVTKLDCVNPTQAIFYFYLFGFLRQVSPCSPDWPGTHSVDQAGLELRNISHASASFVLG